MWFATLAYVTLAVATTLQPVTSNNIEKSARSSESDKTILKESYLATNIEFNLGKGWGAVKSLFDNPSKITDAIHEGFDSLSASAHTWRVFLDKITELSPNIKEYTDGFYHHAVELYPSEKITEFRESIVNVTATAAALRKVCDGAAEDSGVSLHSVIEEHKDIFVVLFEELMEMFPPPGEAPGHDNRTIMINTVATKLGVSEELLKSHSDSLKFVVQHVAVTIGDLAEQHPEIANALLLIAVAELSPLLLPEIGMGTLLDGWLLRPLLHLFGFGTPRTNQRIAAWLQSWIFGPIIPKGNWFAALQRLAMIGTKV
ncbi:uncharacterized protein BJ212DRAFT_1375976 [Suillus subaureus]|uniref:Uncharacterized protein n=1 Tax=Suillus subaureus TaxID=48587 RepID=A0A9P7E4X4_9AGAM|nr:uncharacterized protein BJ212DRAFT_1375976 [Suillus subaureus]KAG1811270.1 hypothetical protein BJ212DRAFT_1375976 [Suillus subaureus]